MSHVDEERFNLDKVHSTLEMPEKGLHGPISAIPFASDLADMAFLLPYLSHLHSIVFVGSGAQGTQTRESDLDFVVIAKEKYLEPVCGAVFDNDISLDSAGAGGGSLEVTVLTESQAEELFALASPFAFAIRYGRLLVDDGYLAAMLAKPHPGIPTREYYRKSLFEGVACQYFSGAKSLEGAVREYDCSLDCCKSGNAHCDLLPTALLPKLIFRMLYLTLPCRGLMPLCKDDVIVFAEAFYPPEVSSAVKTAARLARGKSDVMSFPVYRSLKSASVILFREILAMLDYQEDVRRIVHDAVNSVRGNFAGIENRLLKKCFVQP